MYWAWIFIALASVWFHHRPLAVSCLFPVSHSSVNDVKRLACESYPTCGMLPNNYRVASCSILRLIFNSVVQHLSGSYSEYITIYMLAAGGIIRKNCLCFRSYPDDNLCPRYYSRFWSLNQQGDKNEFSTATCISNACYLKTTALLLLQRVIFLLISTLLVYLLLGLDGSPQFIHCRNQTVWTLLPLSQLSSDWLPLANTRALEWDFCAHRQSSTSMARSKTTTNSLVNYMPSKILGASTLTLEVKIRYVSFTLETVKQGFWIVFKLN